MVNYDVADYFVGGLRNRKRQNAKRLNKRRQNAKRQNEKRSKRSHRTSKQKKLFMREAGKSYQLVPAEGKDSDDLASMRFLKEQTKHNTNKILNTKNVQKKFLIPSALAVFDAFLVSKVVVTDESFLRLGEFTLENQFIRSYLGKLPYYSQFGFAEKKKAYPQVENGLTSEVSGSEWKAASIDEKMGYCEEIKIFTEKTPLEAVKKAYKEDHDSRFGEASLANQFQIWGCELDKPVKFCVEKILRGEFSSLKRSVLRTYFIDDFDQTYVKYRNLQRYRTLNAVKLSYDEDNDKILGTLKCD